MESTGEVHPANILTKKNLCKIISQLHNCGQVLPFLVVNHSRGYNSQNSATKNCIKLLFPHISIKTSQQGRGGTDSSLYRPSVAFRNSSMKHCVDSWPQLMSAMNMEKIYIFSHNFPVTNEPCCVVPRGLKHWIT